MQLKYCISSFIILQKPPANLYQKPFFSSNRLYRIYPVYRNYMYRTAFSGLNIPFFPVAFASTSFPALLRCIGQKTVYMYILIPFDKHSFPVGLYNMQCTKNLETQLHFSVHFWIAFFQLVCKMNTGLYFCAHPEHSYNPAMHLIRFDTAASVFGYIESFGSNFHDFENLFPSFHAYSVQN